MKKALRYCAITANLLMLVLIVFGVTQLGLPSIQDEVFVALVLVIVPILSTAALLANGK